MGSKNSTKNNGFNGQYKKTMGLKDSTKNIGFKCQYKEEWVQKTVQRSERTMGWTDSTKNYGFKEQYKEHTNFGKNYQKVPINW